MNTNENTSGPTRKYKRYDEAFQRSSVEHWLLSGNVVPVHGRKPTLRYCR
jgi:hypothetical protein